MLFCSSHQVPPPLPFFLHSWPSMPSEFIQLSRARNFPKLRYYTENFAENNDLEHLYKFAQGKSLILYILSWLETRGSSKIWTEEGGGKVVCFLACYCFQDKSNNRSQCVIRRINLRTTTMIFIFSDNGRVCWLQIENVFATFLQVYLAERRVVLGLEVSLEKLTSYC